jgi:hypothetical protein
MSNIWIYYKGKEETVFKKQGAKEIGIFNPQIVSFGPRDVFVTLGELVEGFRSYDLLVAHKCLFYNRLRIKDEWKRYSFNLTNLCQIYLHKNPPSTFTPAKMLDLYEDLFVKIRSEVGKGQQTVAMNFEVAFSQTLSLLRNPIEYNVELLQSHIDYCIDLERKLENEDLKGQTKLVKYLKDNKLYDQLTSIYKARVDLSHKSLLSTGDKKLADYVAWDKVREKKDRLTRYKWGSGKVPDFKQMGTVTGRITTPVSEAIGVNPKYYKEGEYFTYDFVANEMMVYLNYFKPPILAEFIKSGRRDFYGFLYVYVTNDNVNPDDVKQRLPKRRKFFKDICTKMMNGSTKEQLHVSMNISIEKADKFYDIIAGILQFKKNRDDLIKYVTHFGAYSVCPKLKMKDNNSHPGKLLKTKETVEYPMHESLAMGRNEKDAGDRSYIIDFKRTKRLVEKRVMAMRVQGTAAIIMKKCLMDLVAAGYDIVLVRYDEVVFKGGDKGGVQEIMKASFKKIMGSDEGVFVN